MRRPFSEGGSCPNISYEICKSDSRLEELWIAPMEDGGMESLFIGVSDDQRMMAWLTVECDFANWDGMHVSVMLNLDQYGDLFELDVWRVGFAPLQSWSEG